MHPQAYPKDNEGKSLIAKPKKRFRVSTTDSKGNKHIFPNLLKGRVAQRPGEIISSDIAYISTTEDWLYLSIIMDLYTREMIGYAVQS